MIDQILTITITHLCDDQDVNIWAGIGTITAHIPRTGVAILVWVSETQKFHGPCAVCGEQLAIEPNHLSKFITNLQG